MARQHARRQPSHVTSMDWQFCEDETAWQQVQTADSGGHAAEPARPRARVPRAYWVVAASLASVILVVGGLLYRTAHAGLNRVESELAGAVTADLWVAGQRPADIKLVDLYRDSAAVQVEIKPVSGQPTIQRTLIYRQTPTGWRRSVPAEVNADTWGRQRELESAWFIFRYYAQDAEAVEQAAAQLDRLFPALYAAFYTDPRPGGKVEFDVAPGLPAQQIELQRNAAGHYTVASPASYAPELQLSDADLLTHSVLLILFGSVKERLASDRLQTSVEAHTVELHRPFRIGSPDPAVVVDGIAQWLVWRSGLPIAAGRQPLVRWGFAELVARDRTPRGQTTTGWTELPASCPWISMTFLSLPLMCAEPEPLMRYLVATSSPSIFPHYSWHGQSVGDTRTGLLDVIEGLYRVNLMAAKVAMATVVEYAAATYGAEHLPALIDAAGSGASWDTLIPAVFGVSRRDFEEGWRLWLLSHYDLSVDS